MGKCGIYYNAGRVTVVLLNIIMLQIRKTSGSYDWKVWSGNMGRLDAFNLIEESFKTATSMQSLVHTYFGTEFPPRILENAKLVGYFTEMNEYPMFELEIE